MRKNQFTILISLLCLTAVVGLPPVFAEDTILCVKNKLKVINGKIKLKGMIGEYSGSCPTHYSQIAETSTFNADKLPTGETIRGYYDVGATAAAGNPLATGNIIFGHEVENNLDSGHVHYIEQGSTPPA